ncbi:hypothetical protein GQ43DRAFT_62340 [Delitschia confertaspora ATCC 74209]|uniref:Uncharacterized protein n=1 Tax=Delitschia confertaspora ATCC 74209 TaxID=1513339 RepID=A0A9P4MV35_9PLEO|nr:hypothetical protein GQ43DRAFT_62340 [Delitschia confertaspora ATCC 74209]
MADMEKPVTFGATIHRPNNEHYLTTLPLGEASSNDSALSSAAITPQSEHDTTNPFSAFYKHPDARRSMEESAQQPATSKVHLSVYEHDLEAGTPLSAATTTTATHPKVSVDGRVKECTMWPSRQTVLEKKKATKRARGCAFFKNLTAKQRLWAKIIIALVIVAAAVGLGVGISRAVGGGVWAGDHESKPIPNN